MIAIMLIVFVVALVVGLPIAIAIGFASVVPNLIDPNFVTDVPYVIRSMVSGIDMFTILALPLFMLSGDIMSKGGISEKLFNVFALVMGKKTAGMPIALVLTCLFFGAISGSGPATCAAVGSMVIPILLGLGYDKKFCGALLATAAGLAVIIPPSLPFVTICVVTGASIGEMMIGGVLPGCLIALFLCIYCFIYCKRNGEDKEKIKANYDRIRSKGLWSIFKESIWALLFPVLTLGGIYGGIVTPTEAACISVYYALIVSIFIYKEITWKDIPGFFRGAVKTYAPICILLAVARAFAKVLTMTGAPKILADFIVTNFTSKYLFLAVVIIILFFIGMVMDCGPANVILAPILLPVAQAFGMDTIHFLMIMVTCLAIGFVTPPFGMNLFVASPIVEVNSTEIGKKAIPFIFANLMAIFIIAFVPKVTLLLLGR